MLEIKNKNINLTRKIILIMAIFGLSFFVFQNIWADENDCDNLTGDDKDKCEVLEKKAKAYEELIRLKNKQQNTLQDQMALIDAEQARNQLELLKNQNKSVDLEQQISRLEGEIKYKEDLVKYQKMILSGLIQSYYEDYQQGVLNIVLASKDFSDIFNQADYMEQSASKIKDLIGEIQTAKSNLEKEQNELEQKKQESEELKKELQNRKYELISSESQKQALLTQTQGEEAKYQQLLARVEQQKLELFNFGSAENLDEIDASVSSYSRPDSKYWASTGWYFSQKDSRWGNKTIGNSNSLMKDYGCAVTAVSMAFKYYGAGIDPGIMAKQKIFSYDLIKWPGSWQPDIALASSVSHGNVNWDVIDSELEKDHLVIVFIKKTNGRGGHYVVIHNKDKKDKYVVHDPYFGSNLYLDTSRSLIGKLGANSSTVIDQMIIYK